MFEGVEAMQITSRSPSPAVSFTDEPPTESPEKITVGGVLTVEHVSAKGADSAHVVIEWQGGAPGDIIADAVTAVILKVCSKINKPRPNC